MALFAYVGAMAIQCKERRQDNILRQIGLWMDTLIQKQLSSWVKQQPRQWVSSFCDANTGDVRKGMQVCLPTNRYKAVRSKHVFISVYILWLK